MLSMFQRNKNPPPSDNLVLDLFFNLAPLSSFNTMPYIDFFLHYMFLRLICMTGLPLDNVKLDDETPNVPPDPVADFEKVNVQPEVFYLVFYGTF